MTGNNAIRWREGERLDQLFEARVDDLIRRGCRDHLAVETMSETISFTELDARANRLARHLIASGLGAADRIGLLFDKSSEAYVAMLAVLKINAAYVPLDTSFPPERMAFIARDAGIKAVLSMAAFEARLAPLGLPILALDTQRDAIGVLPGERLTNAEKPRAGDELCYVIYTSGTTGNPKGVAIDHASICNFVRVAGEIYGYREDDRVYQGMTIAFDFSVEELWVPLIAGATLIPASPGATLVGADLADYLEERRVTAICVVPTLLATIERDLPGLRFLLVSGEACPQSLVKRWHKPGRVLLNAYGPTEATVTATVVAPLPDKPVTIGSPLPTYTIFILDEHETKAVPQGAMGEIAIAGIGLARGYLNRPDLTAKKFVPDTLGAPNNPSGRLYRTGDLGRINEAGEIEFHGRIDTQVKIRGYRIELGEIEAAVLAFPGIGQAVVHTFEEAPGATELVAYYALTEGTPDIPAFEIAQALRRQLPPYMVPAYYERLSSIPMTGSHKVDRKALPPPRAARVGAFEREGPFAAPQSEMEKSLASLLAAIMKLERVSIRDHFFHDLGAHSLLMARYAADIRKRLAVAVSMRDIYLNPTIEGLARHLEAQAALEPSSRRQAVAPREPSITAYVTCGAFQLLYYGLYAAGLIWLGETGYHWALAPDHDLAETYLRIAAFSAASFALVTGLAVAAKWLLIGRWKEECFPAWGPRYLVFWLVRNLVRTAPLALYKGTPLFSVYLRMLGARIGDNVVIETRSFPLVSDLLSIGDNTILRKDSLVLGYKAEAGMIHTGAISIGRDALVGERSLLDIDTSIGDGGQLGHASSLQQGQHVPAGRRFHGSPAVETETDFRAVDGMPCTKLRRTLYSLWLLASTLLVAAPALVLAAVYLFRLLLGYAGPALVPDAGAPSLATTLALVTALSLALAIAVFAVGLAIAAAVPRVLNRFIEPGRTYVRYGFHYVVMRAISRLSNSPFYFQVFGDSSYIIKYLDWIGYRLNRVVQTGSNFGLTQKHDNPLLCDIGSGTMASDSLVLLNTAPSATSFAQRPVRIGTDTYLGNEIYVPAATRIGDNCLIGTRVMIPIDGPQHEGVGLLGSPAFEIPRVVARDSRLKVRPNDPRFPALLARKDRRNAATIAMYLLATWLLVHLDVLALGLAFSSYPEHGTSALYAAFGFIPLFSILYLALVDRASLGFGRLAPAEVSMYEPSFLFHERHWKLGAWMLLALFKGTPFKNVISRMLGVRVGSRVLDDGAFFPDRTLVAIGDCATLNEQTILQSHSLEEAVFKADHVTIGRGCTIGPGALVHYGATLGENVVVDPDSFVMKGETAEPGTIWRGNPAKAITGAGSPEHLRALPVTLPAPLGAAAPVRTTEEPVA